MTTLRALPALLMFAALAGAASAQTAPSAVYRCGPDGKQYSPTPCPGGAALPHDARSAEQRRQAEDIAARERELAQKLQAERQAREKAIVPAAAGGIGASSVAKAASAPAKSSAAGGKGKSKKKPAKGPARNGAQRA